MGEPARPNPDELLRRYGFVDSWSHRTRGRLRILLGAAPGVGKTYAMLREGHRLRGEGHDVVVGFLETHGRPETAAQVGDLETVPRQEIAYRGVVVEEMDTDAVLARKPQIALVDELAHTNAPGSPREKRWQDIELLRDAGIDVVATMNVQHLESLGDVVTGITDIEVRETVPEAILDDAEVQLIDLPVDQLIGRLEQGKVYPPQRARQALEHVFRPGNLTALRELALRQTAAGVEEQLEGFMREHPAGEAWQATENVLVQIDDDPSTGAVLRNGWRLASAMRCPVVGVAVVPPGGVERLPAPEAAALRKNLDLAEDLGIATRVVEGADEAEALAAAAQDLHATVIVLGHTAGNRWSHLRRPLADRLLDRLDGVDIHLVERRDRRR